MRTGAAPLRVGVGLALAALVGVLVAPTAAQAGGATIGLDPTSGPAGTEVDVSGDGFAPGEFVTLRLDDFDDGTVLVEDARPDRNGSFGAVFTVPRVAAGDHLVFLCRRTSQSAPDVCDRAPAARFRVTGATSTTRPTTTSSTTTSSSSSSTTSTTARDDTTTSSSTDTTLPDDVVGEVTTSTTAGDVSVGPGSTTTITAPGVGVYTGPTTTEGLGFGDLVGNADVPDLAITGLEMTQSIQNLDNDMPLVAGRITVLRVHLTTDDGPMVDVSGLLQLVRDGDDEVAVVAPENGPITVDGPGDRLDPDSSLNFVLPDEATLATAPGDRLIATAYAFGTHPNAPAEFEPTDVNNYEADVFDFQGAADIDLHVLPMHMHLEPDPAAPDDTLGTDPVPDGFGIAASMAGALRSFPVADINYHPGPVVYPDGHDQGSEWDLFEPGVESDVLFQIEQVWAATSTTNDHSEQFYGVYDRGIPAEWGGFSNGTVAYGFTLIPSAAVDTGNADWFWYHSGGWLLAHEVGHSMGFPHSPCGGAGDPGPYPEGDCSLAVSDPAGYTGWDTMHHVWAEAVPVAISNDLADDVHAHPVMGYESLKWIDPWHYCRLLVRLSTGCTALSIPENQVDPPDALPEGGGGAESGDPVLWFTIDDVDGSPGLGAAKVVLDPLPHLLAEMTDRQATGEATGLSVVLVDEVGDPLARLTQVAHHRSEGADEVGLDDIGADTAGPAVISLSSVIAWPEGAAAVNLVDESSGEVIDELPVSANAPVIEVAAPTGGELTFPIEVTWTASDPDGDALSFDVDYTPDGGATWVGLAAGLAGDRFVVDDPAGLVGGDEAIFRVTARDGVRTTSATSAPGSLADLAPTVLVVAPGDGTTVPQHATVVMRAGVSDPETPDDLVVDWVSDRDGELGTGTGLSTQALSAGTHELTVTAEDPAGNSASATVTVTVDPATALVRLDADGFDAGLAALRNGPGRAGDDDGGSIVRGLAIAGAIVAVLLGVFAARRARDDTEPAT